MKLSFACIERSISRRAFIFLFVLALLVYSNTFHAGWHFDDHHSIVDNDKIHISEISLSSLTRAIQHPDTQRIWRPLVYLSFALNWYLGQSDVFGYHIVNILLHFVTAFILFHTLLSLFKTPVMRGKTSTNDAYHISLLAAVLWAVNPVQTQSVTYIVQRMTLLAALFCIGGIFFYLRARLIKQPRYRYLFFTLCVISWLLALASKENAILLPLGLILVEAAFFKNLSDFHTLKRYLLFFAAGTLLIGIFGIVIFLGKNPLAIFTGYSDRFFTPWERLMTQPRVLLYYLTQIFFPHPARLSIEHDFAISTSLIHPWITLPAILFVIVLIFGAVSKIQRRPLLCFALLFFFINHAVESFIVPLEIAFEHRNYLPSMFLFAPVAAGAVWLMNRYCKRQPFPYWVIFGLGICLISSFGIATYLRNKVWSSEVSLWSDARRKAPSMHRPVHNLAMALYDNNGRLNEALKLYLRADNLKMHRRSNRAWLYSNIANIHYRTGRYDLAETYYQKAYEIAPKKEFFRYRLAETLIMQEKLNSAMMHVDELLACNPKNSDYLNLKGSILLQQMKPNQALLVFLENLRNNPRQATAYVNAGRALTVIGKFDPAERLFKIGIEHDPENLKIYIHLLDIYLRRGDQKRAEDLSRFLVDSATVNDIRLTIEELAKENFITPNDYNNLLIAISAELGKRIPYGSKASDGE